MENSPHEKAETDGRVPQQSSNEREFSVKTVRILNRVLLYAPEVLSLRHQLTLWVYLLTISWILYKSIFRGFDDKSKDERFQHLFCAWASCAASTLALSLLCQRYHLSSQIVQATANLPVTVDLLIELDKLVQYLESPLYSGVRLHLLDSQHRLPLERALYGVLMLLPQSTAFSALHKRLSTLPPPPNTTAKEPTKQELDECSRLVKYFDDIQAAYDKCYRKEQLCLIQSLPVISSSPESSSSQLITSTPTTRRQ